MTAIELANAQQRAASDPAVSAFVSASAGSGKTQLLTDRLLRLMLSGVAPQKILCLTYTKAAAAEMTIRLSRRLGAWVVLDRDKLDTALRALAVPVNDSTRTRARKLFADVLDLPGGMRIETIHAFCQSLLRRFPLEANLSPHFEVADDLEEEARLREAREAVLADATLRAPVFTLAAETNEQDFAALTRKLAKSQLPWPPGAGIAAISAMQREILGVETDDAATLLAAAVVDIPGEAALRDGWRQLAGLGNASGVKWAAAALDWLGRDPAARAASWAAWRVVYFTDKGEGAARKTEGFFGTKLAAAAAGIQTLIAGECERIETVQERLRAARLAALNAALLALSLPITQHDAAEKQLAARLSYGDLVARTGALFNDPGAAWVLYKLDGGIEHLLLDEVQDTAPAQWEIAQAIAAEFFAGHGTREHTAQGSGQGGGRTIFAVGDAKQSIFSFQGADLQSFEHYRAKFRDQAISAGAGWLDGELSISFRSTAPVLALVDAVFAQGPPRNGVCREGEALRHGVSRSGQAGRVELWPLAEALPPPDLPAWAVPARYEAAQSPTAMLARDIALAIRQRLDAGALLPSRGRAVSPGDFLILVRTRDALVGAITRECKALNIPVAGLDRMVLPTQVAVSDLLALCDALLLPEDDLAFGQFLASPLGGLSDESLMALAINRNGSLAGSLYARGAARADWARALTFFETLRGRIDYLTPFALLSEALGSLGGRAMLLARLGPEAAEPIDELLTEALNFTQSEPGALQVFVHQLRVAGAQVKRETESGGDVVRIMTVHGAKGLQAPIVILPDTTRLPNQAVKETLFWLSPPGRPEVSLPVFCPRAALRSQAVAQAALRAVAAQEEEHNRLLYVALTRAEDELIICGAKTGSAAVPSACWYEAARAGFARLDGVVSAGDGRLVIESAQTAEADRRSTRDAAAVAAMPGWAGGAPGWEMRPPAAEQTKPERLAPSRSVENVQQRAIAMSPLGAGLGAARAARAAAMARGRAIHALLQHLPALPPAARRAAARQFIGGITDLAGQEDAIAGSVLAVLDDPALAALFGPDAQAEIPLAGVVGDVEIGGLVDRLVVTETAVVIADFKTDRAPPAAAADIPAGYLRQLSAYQAILRQIYPDRPISCVLIWTETAGAMPVPETLLAAHAPA